MKISDKLEYGKVGERVLEATLYQADPEQVLPAIIWVHGGAWMHGDCHRDAAYCRAIAEQGFHCLSISYRLSGEAIFPAAIQDCKCAVRFLRANAAKLHIDPERIGAWGPSAGGHLVALLGTSAGVAALEGEGGWPNYSSAVQAVCDWFGPTDFLQMCDYPSDFDHNAADSPESRLIGAPIQTVPEQVQLANPITYISDATPPMLIAHGKQDSIVPFNQSELLYMALVAQGIDVEFEQLDKAGHDGPGFEVDSPLFQKCVNWFNQRLNL